MYSKVQSKALIIITLHLNKVKGVICWLSSRWPHNSVFLWCMQSFKITPDFQVILKGTVHPKMKIVIIYSSSSRSKPVWMCLFWTQRKIFWRMRETEQYFSPTIEVNGVPKQPDYKLSSKYLPLCSEQTHSYRFGSTWGWINDDRIYIFGCTVSLSYDGFGKH